MNGGCAFLPTVSIYVMQLSLSFHNVSRKQKRKKKIDNENIYVPDHMGIWTVLVWSGPYAYIFEILIWSDHTRTVWVIRLSEIP